MAKKKAKKTAKKAAKKTAREIVSGIMNWDGTSKETPLNKTSRTIDKTSHEIWMEEQYRWGRRVRRDILLLEQLLVANKIIKQSDLYVPADPGDPPPPPDEI